MNNGRSASGTPDPKLKEKSNKFVKIIPIIPPKNQKKHHFSISSILLFYILYYTFSFSIFQKKDYFLLIKFP